MNHAPNPEWSDLAERTEAAAMRRMMDDQPTEVVERLGVSAPALADGVHTVVVRDPMWGYWNKALGFCEPVTEATVAAAVTRATDLEVSAFALQMQPRVVPEDWPSPGRSPRLRPGHPVREVLRPGPRRARSTRTYGSSGSAPSTPRRSPT